MTLVITCLERCVSVICGMFYDQVLQNSYSQLSDVWTSLQALSYLSQEQTHKEMILAVVLSKAVLQTLV